MNHGGVGTQEAEGSFAPLKGLLVLDFSQFLAGPSCSLRLADLGADVIKIERPDGGDLCRKLTLADQRIGDDSLLFHAINRNKRSFAADLKDEEDLSRVKSLVSRADVLIQNFRPGVMERLGLSYDVVRELNSRIVYATVTGYGQEGPWRDKPGQDFLAQSLSGLPWLNGDAGQAPVPVGVSIADLFAGAHLVQGILAALLRRGETGRGGKVEVSLLESVLDLQFEQLTTFLQGDGRPPARSSVNHGGVYSGAPYGIYATQDGYLALAMAPIGELGRIWGATSSWPSPIRRAGSRAGTRSRPSSTPTCARGPPATGSPSSSPWTSGARRSSTGRSSWNTRAFCPWTCSSPSGPSRGPRSSPPGARCAWTGGSCAPGAPPRASASTPRKSHGSTGFLEPFSWVEPGPSQKRFWRRRRRRIRTRGT